MSRLRNTAKITRRASVQQGRSRNISRGGGWRSRVSFLLGEGPRFQGSWILGAGRVRLRLISWNRLSRTQSLEWTFREKFSERLSPGIGPRASPLRMSRISEEKPTLFFVTESSITLRRAREAGRWNSSARFLDAAVILLSGKIIRSIPARAMS